VEAPAVVSRYVPVERALSGSQCDELEGVVVVVLVVAVVAAPDDELELPPLAAIATPAPPSAWVVTTRASSAVSLGRNTNHLLSVVFPFRPWNRRRLRRAQDAIKKSL
jgi:hypothetical protein